MDINMDNLPKHIAIILDGNRRWAKKRNLPKTVGHKTGAKNVEKIAKFCNKIGIKYLTVYAFSTENWKRSKEEVAALMLILKSYLEYIIKRLDTENIKIQVIGDPTVLDPEIQKRLAIVTEKTKNNTGLVLNIAFNYGGRSEITRACKMIAKQVKEGKIDIDDITEETISQNLYTAGMPDPDLLIRTSGEIRTSNFLPWQIVYSEYYFPEKNWPEFDEEELLKAIDVYQKRNRKFGGK